jgi:hypothetical protein
MTRLHTLNGFPQLFQRITPFQFHQQANMKFLMADDTLGYSGNNQRIRTYGKLA